MTIWTVELIGIDVPNSSGKNMRWVFVTVTVTEKPGLQEFSQVTLVVTGIPPAAAFASACARPWIAPTDSPAISVAARAPSRAALMTVIRENRRNPKSRIPHRISRKTGTTRANSTIDWPRVRRRRRDREV